MLDSAMYLVIVLLVWSTTWKGIALWHAAKRGEKWWFIALLVLNTVGVLEILYLLFVAKAFSSPTKALEKPKSKKKK